jgi:hypothetical protein
MAAAVSGSLCRGLLHLGPLGLGLLLAGCSGQVQSPPAVALPCLPCPPPSPAPPSPVADPRGVADRLFDERRYAEAAVVYRALLAQDPSAIGADQLLFRLAVVELALAAEPSDPLAGRTALRRLVDEFPHSPYRPVAEAILGWRGELERLRGQLEELKRIDLRQPSDDSRR